MIRLTTEQFSTLPQSILNKPWPRENTCASGSCLDMASFLTYRVLAGNGEWHDGLCSPTMFSGSIALHELAEGTVSTDPLVATLFFFFSLFRPKILEQKGGVGPKAQTGA